MRKKIIYFFVALTITSLGLAMVPTVFSQTQNVKIVSYTYYIDTAGYLDVVGEVQNMGPNTLTSVILAGSVYSSDGTNQASSYTQIGIDPLPVNYLNPGQKAPFYMDFYQPNGGGSWYSVDVGNIQLAVVQANETTSYQYPDLTVTTNTHSIGNNPTGSSGSPADLGVYWVNGIVQNTGSQTAQNVTLFATFYNSTGSVVAVGYSDPNKIGTLAASATAPFKLGAFDINQTGIPSSEKIASYTLLIEAIAPILQGTAPLATPYPSSGSSPTQTSTGSPTDTPSSSSSPQNPQNNSKNPLNPTIIAIIVVIAILIVAGAIVALRKRKPEETKKPIQKKKPK